MEQVAPRVVRILRIACAASLATILYCGIAVASPVPLLPFSLAGIGFIAQMAIVPAVLLIPAIACAATIARGRLIGLMLIGIVVIVAALALWFTAISLFHSAGESRVFRLTLASAIAISVPALGVGFAASLFRRPEGSKMARLGAGMGVVGLCVGAGMFVIIVLSQVLEPVRDVMPVPSLDWNDRPVPVVFAVGIGMLITGLATAAVAQSKRAMETASGGAEAFEVAVICPRCEASQVIPSGGAACAGCRLRIVVEAA